MARPLLSPRSAVSRDALTRIELARANLVITPEVRHLIAWLLGVPAVVLAVIWLLGNG